VILENGMAVHLQALCLNNANKSLQDIQNYSILLVAPVIGSKVANLKVIQNYFKAQDLEKEASRSINN